MSAPVSTDDLTQGAVKYLAARPDVAAVLGAYPTTDVAYLFQHTLWVTMEGSGTTAAVVSVVGGPFEPNPHNTMRFHRLLLQVYVDPQRDPGANVTDPGEAHRRIQAAYRVLDAHLHRPGGGEQMWGTVRTISATRLVEPVIDPVPDGNGLLRLIVFYAVAEG